MNPVERVTQRRPARALIAAILASLAIVAGLLVSPAASQPAEAANLSAFDPGNIISDAVFFNSGAMTEAQIQSFLQARVPTCAASATCLKDYYVTTKSIAADPMCRAYSGGGRERASTIIYKVAKACGVNPQVILVMLQKEQGLISSVWPSAYAYNFAMGANCPDTTGCNGNSSGFFIQVYSGVWQLKRYGNPPGTSNYFNWYAPGKTWNILYNPTSSCGRKAVAIKNQATANLYYYTPYTPNAAALRAGYGTGDSCSSYGNRNFYNYFNDWFGSTQTNTNLVFSVGPDIYVISGTMRYHIVLADWPAYKQTFGTPTAVDSSYLSMFTDGGTASRFIRNSDTGVVAYLDSAQTHRFPTCALVTLWGASCTKLTGLAGADFARIRQGGEMTDYGRTGGYMGQVQGTAFQPYYDSDTLAAVANIRPYAPDLPAAVASTLTAKPVRFAQGRFMTLAGDTRVWLPTADGRLIHLPSWALTSEFGLSASLFKAGVPTRAAAGYTTISELSQFVTCGGALYYAASGKLNAVTSGGENGFPVTALDDATCARLTKASGAPAALFVKATGTQPVYAAAGGALRHITSMTQLVALSGSTSPRILGITASSLALVPHALDYLQPATLVLAAASPKVYLVDDGRLVHLPSFDLALAAGIPTTLNTVTAATISSSTVAPALLSPFIRCNAALYIAGSGALSKVTSGDAAGNVVTDLGATTCGSLPLSGPVVSGRVVLSDGKTWAVAAGGGFSRYSSSSAAAAAVGGSLPAVLTVSTGYLSTLPKPTV